MVIFFVSIFNFFPQFSRTNFSLSLECPLFYLGGMLKIKLLLLLMLKRPRNPSRRRNRPRKARKQRQARWRRREKTRRTRRRTRCDPFAFVSSAWTFASASLVTDLRVPPKCWSNSPVKHPSFPKVCICHHPFFFSINFRDIRNFFWHSFGV